MRTSLKKPPKRLNRISGWHRSPGEPPIRYPANTRPTSRESNFGGLGIANRQLKPEPYERTGEPRLKAHCGLGEVAQRVQTLLEGSWLDGQEGHISRAIAWGIDENTAQLLTDSGIKVGDLENRRRALPIITVSRKRLQSVLEAVKSGPRASASNVISRMFSKKRRNRSTKSRSNAQAGAEGYRFRLNEKKEELRIAKVEAFRSKKLVMNRLGKTIEP